MGIAVVVLGDRQFKKVRTAINPFDQPSVLVTSGVFRVSRNPMYLAAAAHHDTPVRDDRGQDR